MKYFQTGKKEVTESRDPLYEKARAIVQLARLHEPDFPQLPDDPEAAAREVTDKILRPVPDLKNGNSLGSFSDLLDMAVTEALVQRVCGLRRVEDPFSEFGRYAQVRLVLEFKEPGLLSRGGWFFKIITVHHGADGEAKVQERCTKTYPRRLEAAWEALSEVLRRPQVAYTSNIT
jgi:hypothetical protein